MSLPPGRPRSRSTPNIAPGMALGLQTHRPQPTDTTRWESDHLIAPPRCRSSVSPRWAVAILSRYLFIPAPTCFPHYRVRGEGLAGQLPQRLTCQGLAVSAPSRFLS